MSLFIWDTQPSKIFVGDTQISKVFVWDTQVRPSGWQPLNPICWYKFDWDYADSTWNFGVASGTSSFQTLSSGVQVLQTDGTNLVSLPSGITANSISTYTIAFWMKPITTNPNYWYYAWCGYEDSTHISFYENTSWRDFVEWYGGNRDLTTSWVWAWWRMVCFRSNGSTCDLVVNWNNKTATTTAPSIFGYSTDNIFVLWARTLNIPAATWQKTSVQISNFVISNSYWDDTELMGMYNATKDNYPATLNSLQNINLTPTNEINITPNNNGSGNVQSI